MLRFRNKIIKKETKGHITQRLMGCVIVVVMIFCPLLLYW